MAPVWYLGPAGDLQPIRCPEVGMEETEVRYGGTHQSLSGIRTIDVTGFRAQYNLDLHHMDDTEWARIRAMHTRFIPGPLYFRRPGGENLLSLDSSRMQLTQGLRGSGVLKSSTVVAWQATDFPAGVGPGPGLSLHLDSFGTNAWLRFDDLYRIPVSELDTVTASFYAKASVDGQQVAAVVDPFDIAGNPLTSTWSFTTLGTTDWTRVTRTLTMPAGTTTVRMACVLSNFVGATSIAAPQLELSPTASPWGMGGFCPAVGIDQFTTTVPDFGYHDGSLTLLEL